MTQAARILFVAPTSPELGVSAISLGLVRALQATGVSVGFVKPIADPDVAPGQDRSVAFARTLLGLDPPEPIAMERAEAMIRAGDLDALLEEVVGMVADVRDGRGIVVVQGAAPALDHALVADLDLAVARSLSAEIVAAVSGLSGDVATIAAAVADAAHRFGRDGLPPAGVAVGRLPAGLIAAVKAAPLAARLLAVVSEDPSLAAPRLSDVVADLGLTVVRRGAIEVARVRDMIVAARSVEHLVSWLRPGTLVATPGDRSDVIIMTALASAGGMPIAGLLLTCGALPSDDLAGFLAPRWGDLTVLATDDQTFDAATRLAAVDRRTRIDDKQRMSWLIDHAAEGFDVSGLAAATSRPNLGLMPPPIFRNEMIRRARAAKKRIVLPEGDEPRTIRAAAICAEKGIAHCLLLGKPETIRAVAAKQGVELPPGDRTDRSRYNPRQLYRADGGAAPRQGTDRRSGRDGAAGYGRARHDDARRGPCRRARLGGRAHHRLDGAAGAAVDQDGAGFVAGVERVLHADARPGAGLRRLRRQSRSRPPPNWRRSRCSRPPRPKPSD